MVFEQGNVRQPIVIGNLWNVADSPPTSGTVSLTCPCWAIACVVESNAKAAIAKIVFGIGCAPDSSSPGPYLLILGVLGAKFQRAHHGEVYGYEDDPDPNHGWYAYPYPDDA